MGQIEETLKQLQQGVQELQESEKYKSWHEVITFRGVHRRNVIKQ